MNSRSGGRLVISDYSWMAVKGVSNRIKWISFESSAVQSKRYKCYIMHLKYLQGFWFMDSFIFIYLFECLWLSLCHFHVGISVLIMVLWPLFGNQWLHTPAHDLMREGDPEKENKFNIVVGGRTFPWGRRVKNEAWGLHASGRILGSYCWKIAERWSSLAPPWKEEAAEILRGGETDHRSHGLLFRSQDKGPGLLIAIAIPDPLSSPFSFLYTEGDFPLGIVGKAPRAHDAFQGPQRCFNFF